jgi:ferredoxin-NADP reductase
MKKVKLISKQYIAEQSLLFTVERPNGFSFKSGQFVEIQIPTITEKIEPHYFSIVSSEQSPQLDFLARMRDSIFKNTLHKLTIGEKLEISDASGKWTLEQAPSKKILFLIGGVGIASVMSILNTLENEKNEGLDRGFKITILYSNKKIESTSFFKELYTSWNTLGYNTYFALTQESVQKERVSSKRIDLELIKQVALDCFDARLNEDISYYICGGSDFVVNMRKLLVEGGVDVKFLKLDLFTGY